MNTYTPEHMIAAQKSALETLFGLTSKTLEGVEKLVELNMQVAKSTLAEAADRSQAVLSVKDVQELMAMQVSMLQPAAEKAVAYSRHVYDIVAATGAEYTKAAEVSMADGQRTVMSLVDNAARNAPAGSENAVALVRSAMAAANNAFESVQKATRQAAEVADANFQAMTSTAVSASRQAAAKARRAA